MSTSSKFRALRNLIKTIIDHRYHISYPSSIIICFRKALSLYFNKVTTRNSRLVKAALEVPSVSLIFPHPPPTISLTFPTLLHRSTSNIRGIRLAAALDIGSNGALYE